MTDTTNRMTPTVVYLLSLQSAASKRVMASRLNITAKLLQGLSSHDGIDWSKVDYQVVLGLVATMKAEGKSPATVNSYLAAVKGAAREAWRIKALDVDTYQHIKDVKRVRGSRSDKGRSLVEGELSDIINYEKAKNTQVGARNAAIFAMMYAAGLRRQEVVDLNFKNINTETGELLIQGKGDKQRTTVLSRSCLMVVQEYLQIRGNSSGRLFIRSKKGGMLFGDSMSSQAIYNMVKEVEKDLGLVKISCHDYRRSFCTDLIENGVDLFTVSKLMGHSSIETTKVYDKRDQTVKNAASSGLNF